MSMKTKLMMVVLACASASALAITDDVKPATAQPGASLFGDAPAIKAIPGHPQMVWAVVTLNGERYLQTEYIDADGDVHVLNQYRVKDMLQKGNPPIDILDLGDGE